MPPDPLRRRSPTDRNEADQMLWIILLILVVLFLTGGIGYGRRGRL
jgi:flagellar basal body-associated protein FliL